MTEPRDRAESSADAPLDDWERAAVEALERFDEEWPSAGARAPSAPPIEPPAEQAEAPAVRLGNERPPVSLPVESPAPPPIAPQKPRAEPYDRGQRRGQGVGRRPDPPVAGRAKKFGAQLRGAWAGTARAAKASVRSRGGLDARELAIVILCLVGLFEAGWIGLRILRGPDSVAVATDDSSALDSSDPASLPPVAAPARPARPEAVRQPDSTVRAASVGTSGWLTITAPVPVDVFERGRKVGRLQRGRMRLPAGRHDLRFVNDALGVNTGRSLTLAPGATVSVVVDVPPGSVSLNAVPWASVTIDGAAVGDTPLANLSLAAGHHDVLFTHPTLGERRFSVTIASGKPLRLSADLRQ